MRSQHEFSQTPRADIARSSFNLSHGLKTTFDADFIVPIIVADIIPGDTWNLKCSFFMRLATPLFPIMDNMYAETHFFFVPYRTIWANFERLHGAQDDPGQTIDFTIPINTIGEGTAPILAGDLGDYMGLPKGWDPNVDTCTVLPARAYRKIWNDWYRDQNLQNSLNYDTNDGPDTRSEHEYDEPPQKRGKRFDYFTSCLPSPQRGTAVAFPIGTSDVKTAGGIGAEIGIKQNSGASWTMMDAAAARVDVSATTTNAEANKMYTDEATASINDIRLAFQTQRLLERDARSGTRYVEALKAHWGVTSPDHRLQRAEFLGGGSTAISITPVQQQSAQTTPVANDTLGHLSAYGTVSGTHSFSKSFVEHGVLIGLVNVRADLTYSQGLERYWGKTTRFEFFYPVLSGIGEQAVLQEEIWYTTNNPTQNAIVFGYQGRYDEYRFMQNRLSGLMRPDATGTLAAWNLSEDFSAAPTLGSTFITANLGVPLDRAISIPSEPHFIADFYFDIKAARPMPTFGIPGNLDRL